MENLKMQSPWVCYTNKIREMFKRDPNIKMVWNDDTLELKMYVNGEKKAEAISELLPTEKAFGKNVVKITIIPANMEEELKFESVGPVTVERAFVGNPIYKYTKVFKDAFIGQPVVYVVFAKEVIQWFNDDLNDLFGNANMLAEDIAREIFADANLKGIMFCTDIED